MMKGPWTPEEDDLANNIKTELEGRWRTLPKHVGILRCGKSFVNRVQIVPVRKISSSTSTAFSETDP
ncbi:hypothetical protein V2J09_018320 [Rumex salicifolius]